MRIRHDATRDRVIAGGLDSMIKFFQPSEEEGKQLLQVVHKIKLPSEVFSLDISRDGLHFAMGLNDSSLVIKSKLKEENADNDERDVVTKMYE
jgi:hypothetical protein